jgi:hypothetical protein
MARASAIRKLERGRWLFRPVSSLQNDLLKKESDKTFSHSLGHKPLRPVAAGEDALAPKAAATAGEGLRVAAT